MIVVAGGANLALKPPASAVASLDRGVVLAQLETPIATSRALFEEARVSGSVILLNAAPAIEAGAALFPLVDILIVNETELARFAGAAAPPTQIEDVAALARRLISREGQRVVVTLGAAGAVAVDDASMVVVPGRSAKVVDTTGAGDCFCGVLAAGLSEGAGLTEAMAEANAAAALSTECHGAAVSMPSRDQIAAFIGRGT